MSIGAQEHIYLHTMKSKKPRRPIENLRATIVFASAAEKAAAVRMAKSQGRSLSGHIRWMLAQAADGNTPGK